MSLIQYNGRDYCLAEAPNVAAGSTSSSTKFIDWKLDKTNFGTIQAPRPVEFHKEAGIVIVRDAHQDLIDKNNRGRGKGGGPDDKGIFHVKTKIKNVAVQVGYLPVILWDPLNNDNWELCAAIDPKIVNVP